MPLGKGIYDDLATEVRTKAKARGAVVIVFSGGKGNGFSVQLPADLLFLLPQYLREMADQIEQNGPF